MIRFAELWRRWRALWAKPRCICRDVEVTEVPREAELRITEESTRTERPS